MKWLKRIGIAVGVLLLILVAIPLFISLDDYIPIIEKEISAKLNEPVKIKKISLSLLPTPHVTVDGIAVGKTQDLSVGKVTVTPAVFSLLRTPKVISAIEIDSLVATQKALDKVPTWTKSDPSAGPAPVRVENIVLDNAVLKLDKATFGPFDARVTLNSAGEPEEASVKTQDGKLKALVKPGKSKNYEIEASAKSWKVPVGPPVAIDELLIKGVATTSHADFSQITAKLYGGSVAGKAAVNWQKGMQVKGNFDINQVELKDLVPLLSPGNKVSGKLNAKPVFSAAAASPDQLMNALRLQTPFDVKNGVLHGVDIHKAASVLVKQGTTGGETRFDQLSGHLDLNSNSYRFTQLKISSGSLAADGDVSISPKKELGGRVNAKLGSGAVSASIPLTVAGTVNSPILYPSASALAGMAAGAAGTVLAPGSGVATKAAAAIGGLFGRKDTKK